jgi:hypothetical protein
VYLLKQSHFKETLKRFVNQCILERKKKKLFSNELGQKMLVEKKVEKTSSRYPGLSKLRRKKGLTKFGRKTLKNSFC